MSTITIDLTNLAAEDDDNTTEYSGEAWVGKTRINGYGTDRGDNSLDDVIIEVGKQLGRDLSRDEEIGLMDALAPGKKYTVNEDMKISEARSVLGKALKRVLGEEEDEAEASEEFDQYLDEMADQAGDVNEESGEKWDDYLSKLKTEGAASVVLDMSNVESEWDDYHNDEMFSGYALVDGERIDAKGGTADGDFFAIIYEKIAENLGVDVEEIEEATEHGDINSDPLKRTITIKKGKVHIPNL